MDQSPNTDRKTEPPRRRVGLSRHAGNSFKTPKKSTIINTVEMTPDTNDTLFKSKDKGKLDTSKPSSKSKASNDMENISKKSNSNSATVSSRPSNLVYKLSLCKATTEVMTRKRIRSQQSASQMLQAKRSKLDLKADNVPAVESVQIESCDTEPLSDDSGIPSERNEPLLESSSLLQKEIVELKDKIARTEKHHRKVFELESLIAKWREAGVEVIEKLKDPLRQDAKTILAHHNIDPALFHLDLSQ